MGIRPGLVVSALLPYYLLVACMVAVAHATSDEAADGMDHFKVKVNHIEVSFSSSWSVELT